MRRINERKQIAPWRRRLTPIGSVLSAAFGVLDLVKGEVAAGVFFLTLAFLGVTSVLRQKSDERRGESVATSFQIAKAYTFFGACALGGVALFVLAVLGATRDPALSGALGLILAGGAVYIMVRGAIYRRR